MAEMFRYLYYVIGRSVRLVGVGDHRPADHIKMPRVPKGAPLFVEGDTYMPEPLKMRRFKIKCVYAPDWDSAVAFVKSQWQEATIK